MSEPHGPDAMEPLLRATARAESRHFWFRGFRRFVAPRVAEAVRTIDRPRLLDCGCGTGSNLDWLGRFGRAWGIERSAYGVGLARAEGRRQLVRGDVVRLPFASASFDLVASFDVLYSLDTSDEQAALREACRVLRPGGALVLNVAAMEWLRGDHSAFSGERRRYSRARLRGALEAAGFRIEQITYAFASLVPLLLIVRSVQRWRGLASRDRDITVPPAALNAGLSALLAAEARVSSLVALPFGSSLLAVARKPIEPPSATR